MHCAEDKLWSCSSFPVEVQCATGAHSAQEALNTILYLPQENRAAAVLFHTTQKPTAPPLPESQS